jgi:hypothetical protein
MAMRKFIPIFLFLILSLAACGPSLEAEEIAKYHNDYVENVNTLATQVDEQIQKSFATESPKETYELQTENVLPLIDEIKKYIETQKPQSDEVKELHDLRLKQLSAWEEAFQFQYQALEKTIAEASEEEVSELLKESDQKLLEAAELGQKADSKLMDLAEEHDVTIN